MPLRLPLVRSVSGRLQHRPVFIYLQTVVAESKDAPFPRKVIVGSALSRPFVSEGSRRNLDGYSRRSPYNLTDQPTLRRQSPRLVGKCFSWAIFHGCTGEVPKPPI